MIELYNTFGGNKANLSIYTPQRANVSLNLTRIDVLSSTSGRVYVFPSEEFEIEIQLNNTGELEARDVQITPRLGDFELISTDARAVSSMCPGSVESFKYRLKAPYRAARANLTLYFELEYTDDNLQLGRVTRRTDTYPVEVEINPPVLTVTREVSNRTLLYQGRVIRVTVTINNTGDMTAYDVKWSDLPPSDLFVLQGTTSWEGNLPGGRAKRFVYEVISDDPIGCAETSTVTYKDRLGNEYRASSGETTTRFSPKLVVYKTIGALKWNANETGPVITINRTANITVEIKNAGNAIARNVLVEENIKGLEVLSGTTSWKGELLPDQTVSYTYTVRPTACSGITANTTVNYSDIDVKALNRTLQDIPEGKCACYCTKTLEEVKFTSSEKLSGLYPDLNITVVNGTSRKVMPGCIFEQCDGQRERFRKRGDHCHRPVRVPGCRRPDNQGAG
ncbi:MAG: hypothetical protein GXO65_01135 [Euryarchaeota archaeon]|nr:hypothetical protein [Euryarchaeota archaeon]